MGSFVHLNEAASRLYAQLITILYKPMDLLNYKQGNLVTISIVIIILGISFMQGIYTYIPETNHVPMEHCVATILM
jgi:hypothetical protein